MNAVVYCYMLTPLPLLLLLLLLLTTLYGMLTPLLNVNIFMECHHLYGMLAPLFQARRSIS